MTDVAGDELEDAESLLGNAQRSDADGDGQFEVDEERAQSDAMAARAAALEAARQEAEDARREADEVRAAAVMAARLEAEEATAAVQAAVARAFNRDGTNAAVDAAPDEDADSAAASTTSAHTTDAPPAVGLAAPEMSAAASLGGTADGSSKASSGAQRPRIVRSLSFKSPMLRGLRGQKGSTHRPASTADLPGAPAPAPAPAAALAGGVSRQ